MSAAVTPQDLRGRDAAVSADAQRVFDRPFVVEAGAGTGKTTLLVARCLAWSLGPGWKLAEDRLGPGDDDALAGEVLSRVAAITFTEAAAAEMAKRLGDVLAEVAAGKLRQGIDAGALPDPELREQRARALLGALDRWVVRTIHAFCRRLLAQHALAAGLHPEFQVDAEGRAARAVAREVVEAAVREGYDEPGDPDLIALGVDGAGPPELEEALLAFLNEGVEPEALAEPAFTPERIDALIRELGSAALRFARAQDGRLAGVRTAITRQVVEGLDAVLVGVNDCGGDLASLDALAEALRKSWTKSARKRLREWSRKGFNPTETKALADAARAAAAAAPDLCAAIERTASLRPLRFERARRVLLRLLGSARERMRERGAIGFSGLLRETRDLLRDHPEVRGRARAELDQLLVDEFQDTDPVQCEIVRLLALEPGAGRRPGLFLVGDPKQSIYGWRQADLRAYNALVGEALGPGVAPALLCVNRRSLPAILEEVERAVAPVMTQAGDDQAVFQPLVASEQRESEAQAFAPEPPRACVEHWVSWAWDAEAGAARAPRAAEAARLEAAALARDLALLKQTPGFEWKQAGLLMRTWSDLEIYLAALREAGIPYAVEGGRSYRERREVIDASALVRCVLDPNDHLALLTWLRSPSVGVPDAALIPLWTRELPRRISGLAGPAPAPLAEALREIEAACADLPAGIPGLDRIAGWEQSLAFAVTGIAHLRASFASDAVDLFVEKLRGFTLLDATEAARFPGAFRLANLDRFFRELRAELEAEDADVQALLRRLRAAPDEEPAAADARPELAAQDAVQVMTIHGAKGLELRHCYLLQLHKGSGQPPGADAKPVVKELDGRWEYRVFDAPSPGFSELAAREQRVAAAERVRALYVAMTRARDRLVLLGNRPLNGKGGAREESLLELLRSRRETPDSLADAMARAQEQGLDGERDASGVRWRFPALSLGEEAPRAPASAEGDVDPAELDAELRALDALRGAAQRRMQRAFRAPASADAHADERERRAERVPELRAARETAAAAGTAVHRVLEELRLGADPRQELAHASAGLAAWIDASVAAGERAAALASAQETLARFADGPLLERFAALRDTVIARELPVLLPAEAAGEGPVGFVSGSIDLLYRDPASGELVVADYKTDRVEGEAALRERAARYAGQAGHYRRAIQEALGLPAPPRFELWFLRAGAVIPVA